VNVVGSGVSIGIGASVYSPANNKLVLGTANSERVSIGTDGSITASDRLGIQGAPASNYGLKVNAPGSGGHIQLAWNGTANAYLNSDSSGKIYFESTDSMILKTGNAERVTIDTSGNMTLNTGNLVIGTAGKGIDFSATGDAGGMTSELLDDYEEGTWTPTQGGGITLVGTFSSGGDYIKIGSLVHLTGWIQGSTSIAISAGASSLSGGLPFNIKAGGDEMRYDFIVGSGGVTGGGYAWNTSFYTYSMTTNISATSEKIHFQLTYSVL
jgi:hypothetical protein